MIDVGEPATVPDDFTETELQTGIWWRHLVAGAAAGAMSRTCTAPFDRLKLFLMVCGFFCILVNYFIVRLTQRTPATQRPTPVFFNPGSVEPKGIQGYPRVPRDSRCAVKKLNCVRHLRPLDTFSRLLMYLWSGLHPEPRCGS